MINELAQKAHQNAKSKGFFDYPKNIGEMIALMHSELSEALEADRKGIYCTLSENGFRNINGEDDEKFKQLYDNIVKGTFEEEMADIIIRVLDMCAWRGIDLDNHIAAKMRFNSLREHKHGKRY